MVYSFDLDMTPGGVPQIVRLSRYDKKIPELEFTLWNGASGYTIPTGATVFITGSKPDKTGFEYECTYTGSVVSVEVTEQMTAVAGRVVCELTVATSNGKKGSANFFLDVEPSALSDDTVISETDIPIIQHIPEIVAECEDYAETAHKWATFGNDSEIPSSTNNALYWAQKAQEYAVGALHWKASVAFANIPTTGMEVGDMYNITDAFTTDARFDEGAGVKCSAGTNIVWDANGKWDILISSTNAADINFDNTGTGMTATNVQNAITELNTVKQASTDNNLTTTDKTVTGAINEINTSLSAKQNATDNSLTTTNKTISGAINELNSNLTDYITIDTINITPWSVTSTACNISTTQISDNLPTGYALIGIAGVITAAGWAVKHFDISNGQYAIGTYNLGSGTTTNADVTVRRLLRKNY